MALTGTEDDVAVFRSGPAVRVIDRAAIIEALDEGWDDGFVGPPEECPYSGPRARSTEDEARARVLRKIVADPLRGWRHLLVGDRAMVRRLRAATATSPHFAEVTGIVERAVRASAATGGPVRFPPVLMLSEPGVGKNHYARVLATALRTRVVPIAMNATSDRGLLGGSSPAWRGARMGRLAGGLLLDCETAAPLYLLDEIDKSTCIAGEDVASVLLNVLERENAKSFVDEYLDHPVRLDHALFLASANDVAGIPAPLLSRLLVVEVPRPSRDQARVVARAIAAEAVDIPFHDDAIELLVDLSARRARQAVELAHPYAVCARRAVVSADDVRRAVALIGGGGRRGVGFTAGLATAAGSRP